MELLFRRFDSPTTTQPRADRRGLQRFVHNDRVDLEVLQQRPLARTLAAVAKKSVLLVAHDTTEVNLVGPVEPRDAGPLRSNAARGYLAHSAVAIDPDGGDVLGVVHTQAWTRSWRLRKGDHRNRPAHKRESIKWRRSIRAVSAAMREHGVQAEVIHVMDAEGEGYENFAFATRTNTRVVVRVTKDRRIAESEDKLWVYLKAQHVACTFKQRVRAVPVGKPSEAVTARGRKAIDAHKAAQRAAGPLREATLQVRFGTVTLTGRKGARRPVMVTAVLATEENPPSRYKAVEWMVLTTCEVSTAAQAQQVLSHYQRRYGIEPVHRMYKSALHLESEAVQNLTAFRRLLALHAVAATQITQWVHAARAQPRAAAAPHVPKPTLEALKDFSRLERLSLPRRAWTLADVVTRLAQLGGYEVRPDRRPGWIVIWRGWQRLVNFTRIRDFVRNDRRAGVS